LKEEGGRRGRTSREIEADLGRDSWNHFEVPVIRQFNVITASFTKKVRQREQSESAGKRTVEEAVKEARVKIDLGGASSDLRRRCANNEVKTRICRSIVQHYTIFLQY
jgi:hypothetical protein